MQELEMKLAELCKGIVEDCGKNSKAAHQRIRKATLEIAKTGKLYRKASLEADNAEKA